MLLTTLCCFLVEAFFSLGSSPVTLLCSAGRRWRGTRRGSRSRQKRESERSSDASKVAVEKRRANRRTIKRKSTRRKKVGGKAFWVKKNDVTQKKKRENDETPAAPPPPPPALARGLPPPLPRHLGPQSPHQRCGLSPPRLSGPSRIVPCPSGSKAGSFVLFLSLSFSVAAFGQRPRLRPLARRPLPGLRGPFAPLRPRGGRTEGALLEVFLGEALRELCPAPRGARRPLRLCRRRRFEVVPGPKAPKKRTEKRDGASRGAPRPPRASSTDTLLLARADAP